MMTTMMKAPKCDNEFDFLEERMKAKRRKRNQMKRPVKGEKRRDKQRSQHGNRHSFVPPSLILVCDIALRCNALRPTVSVSVPISDPVPAHRIQSYKG